MQLIDCCYVYTHTAEPPSCSHGFLHSDTLIQIVASIGVTPGPDFALVYLHRDITFNCVANVTKVSVAAKVNKEDTRATKIKICRGGCGGSNNIYTFSLTSFNVTSYLNVYEYVLDPPVVVSQGCYIVTEHSSGSSSSIYYQQLTDKPLMSVKLDRESKENCIFPCFHLPIVLLPQAVDSLQSPLDLLIKRN